MVEFTKRIDVVCIEAKDLSLDHKEIENVYSAVDERQISAFKFMKERFEKVERRVLDQVRTEIEDKGIQVRSLPRQIQSVGCRRKI